MSPGRSPVLNASDADPHHRPPSVNGVCVTTLDVGLPPVTVQRTLLGNGTDGIRQDEEGRRSGCQCLPQLICLVPEPSMRPSRTNPTPCLLHGIHRQPSSVFQHLRVQGRGLLAIASHRRNGHRGGMMFPAPSIGIPPSLSSLSSPLCCHTCDLNPAANGSSIKHGREMSMTSPCFNSRPSRMHDASVQSLFLAVYLLGSYATSQTSASIFSCTLHALPRTIRARMLAGWMGIIPLIFWDVSFHLWCKGVCCLKFGRHGARRKDVKMRGDGIVG